ncbi:MAG: hypothetical protein HY784_02185 [Chloroflexi bacterium]|nr:hypothetical protein [Chloroflexota bacterium]
MWTFLSSLDLIRYLILLRVNSPLVLMPGYLPAELSRVLGTTIANRLPTREAQAWHKALQPWQAASPRLPKVSGASPAPPAGKKRRDWPAPSPPPDRRAWPIESVLFAYPAKKACGAGELILWELKLLREAADHGLFLELILPALEEAGFAAGTPWYGPTTLWGHYNIHAIYAARGHHWEPVVQDGQLDLRYRASSTQWAEALPPDLMAGQTFRRLTWLTPFDLAGPAPVDSKLPGEAMSGMSAGPRRGDKRAALAADDVPTLAGLLEALLQRMSRLLPGKHNPPDAARQNLDPDEQLALTEALDAAAQVHLEDHGLAPAPGDWPGRWLGAQTFTAIPRPVLPYLQVASILHLGGGTHFGCGTFRLE